MASTKRESVSEKTRAKIIQSTIQLLIKKGATTSVSTEDVCTAAKLARPTLYHYFPSKRDLLLAVHKIAIERDLKPLRSEAATIDDPVKRLEYIIRVFTRNICLHPELRVLIHETQNIKDKHFREVTTEWKGFYRLVRDTMDQLTVQDRACNSIRPSWGAFFVTGMLTWITYWFDYNKKGSIDEIADAAVTFVFTGIGVKN